ncbi:MAG: hypothetical protein IJ494_09925 [Bacteroides sp.]|nr:hypothetical protein [Bacteroides sp.]
MTTNKFKAFFEEHFHTMVRYAYTFLSDIQESEDIVQDAFLHLYQNFAGMENDEHARTYLYTIVHNLCISQIRH